MVDLHALRIQFPNITLHVTNARYHPRNEDAVYLGAPPDGWTERGTFLRITNRRGGGDTVSVTNAEEIQRLCAWHDKVQP